MWALSVILQTKMCQGQLDVQDRPPSCWRRAKAQQGAQSQDPVYSPGHPAALFLHSPAVEPVSHEWHDLLPAHAHRYCIENRTPMSAARTLETCDSIAE